MTEAPVNARVAAVKVVDHGLAAYGRALAQAITSARSDVNRAGAEIDAAVARHQQSASQARQRREMAQGELQRCRENCGPLQAQLRQAQVAEQLAARDLEKARGAQQHFHRVAQELLSTMTTIGEAGTQAVPAGREYVREYAEILTHYLRTGA